MQNTKAKAFDYRGVLVLLTKIKRFAVIHFTNGRYLYNRVYYGSRNLQIAFFDY